MPELCLQDKCFKHNHMAGSRQCVRVYFCVACLCVYRKRLWNNSVLIMPLMIDGMVQLHEWLDWTWLRLNAFLACREPTSNTEPEGLSAAPLAPLTERCLLQCTIVVREDYVRRSCIAAQKICFSRNCFSLSKIPGPKFVAVSSAAAVCLCAHLWLFSFFRIQCQNQLWVFFSDKKSICISIQNHNGCIKTKILPAHLTRQWSMSYVSSHQSINRPGQHLNVYV